MNFTAYLVLFLVLVLTPFSLAGEIKFNQDNSKAIIQRSGTTVNFNLTENITDFRIYEDRLGLDKANFSVNNSSNSDISVNLYEWNLSATKGRTMVNFTANTSQSHNVNFTLENLTDKENYTVERDGSFFEYVKADSSGDISFNSSNWSYHEFTVEVTYTQPFLTLSIGQFVIQEGDSIAIDCSASDEDGIDSETLEVSSPSETFGATCNSEFSKTDETGTYVVNYTANDTTGERSSISDTFEVDESTTSSGGGGGGSSFSGDLELSDEENDTKDGIYTRKWSGNISLFNADNISKKVQSLREIEIRTRKNVSETDIKAQTVGNIPDYALINNSYSYISINLSETADSNLETANLIFQVNSTFAERFDSITALRFNKGWQELPTNLSRQEKDKNIYKASTPGFSLFAIQGKHIDKNKSVAGENESDSAEREVNKTCNKGCEQNITEKQSDEKTDLDPDKDENITENIAEQIQPAYLYISGLVLLAAVLSGVIITTKRRETKQEKVERAISKLKNELDDSKDSLNSENSEGLKELFNRAQRAIIDNDYDKAYEILKDIDIDSPEEE